METFLRDATGTFLMLLHKEVELHLYQTIYVNLKEYLKKNELCSYVLSILTLVSIADELDFRLEKLA